MSLPPDSARTAPIAPLQNGMLFHSITHPGRGVDIEQIQIEFEESVDTPRLIESFSAITARYDILRTAFRWADVAEPVQIIAASASVPITHHDWRYFDDNERQGAKIAPSSPAIA